MDKELKLTGTIYEIGETQSGTSKAGKAWKKLSFLLKNNDGYEGKEQVFSFELFGEEKVDKFLQYNEVGNKVDVKFNIDCREYKGKYYTNLSAWSVWSLEERKPTAGGHQAEALDEDPPF